MNELFLKENELAALPQRIEVLIDKANKTPAGVIEFFKWCIENTGHEFDFSCWLGATIPGDEQQECNNLRDLRGIAQDTNLCGTAACVAGSVSTILALYRPGTYSPSSTVLDNTIDWAKGTSLDEDLIDIAVGLLCENARVYGQADMECVKKEDVYHVLEKVAECETWGEASSLVSQLKESFHRNDYDYAEGRELVEDGDC